MIQVTFEIISSRVIVDWILKFNNGLFAICWPDLPLLFLLITYVCKGHQRLQTGNHYCGESGGTIGIES